MRFCCLGGVGADFHMGSGGFSAASPNTVSQKSNAAHFVVESVGIFEKWHSRRCAEA
jgi:hypothetical protein